MRKWEKCEQCGCISMTYMRGYCGWECATDAANGLKAKVHELEASVETEMKANSEALDREIELKLEGEKYEDLAEEYDKAVEKVRELEGKIVQQKAAHRYTMMQWLKDHNAMMDTANKRIIELEEGE